MASESSRAASRCGANFWVSRGHLREEGVEAGLEEQAPLALFGFDLVDALVDAGQPGVPRPASLHAAGGLEEPVAQGGSDLGV